MFKTNRLIKLPYNRHNSVDNGEIETESLFPLNCDKFVFSPLSVELHLSLSSLLKIHFPFFHFASVHYLFINASIIKRLCSTYRDLTNNILWFHRNIKLCINFIAKPFRKTFLKKLNMRLFSLIIVRELKLIKYYFTIKMLRICFQIFHRFFSN